jgi:hypothetical protein
VEPAFWLAGTESGEEWDLRAWRDTSGVCGPIMKARVSWEDDTGNTHRWDLVFDENDPEARHFLEALQLHVRFKLDSFDEENAAD